MTTISLRVFAVYALIIPVLLIMVTPVWADPVQGVIISVQDINNNSVNTTGTPSEMVGPVPTDLAANTSVSKLNRTNLTVANTSVATAMRNWTDPLHIENGKCVPINSTVDISSLGWGISQITWYGRYVDDFNPGNQTPLFSLPVSNTARALKNFYVDPRIFDSRKGYWYEYYPNMQGELSANLRLFYVNDTCPPPVAINYTVNLTMSEVHQTVPEPLPWLPQRRESDLLIASGDSITISAANNSHYWIFGYNPSNRLYDVPSNSGGIITLDTDKWLSWGYGNLKIAYVNPGSNGVLEEQYNPSYGSDKQEVIESPFRNVKPINIFGLDPMSVLEHLRSAVAYSIDDNITIFNMQYQSPVIEIDNVDGLSNPNNDTFLDVRGYTNVANGTTITLTIDSDKLNAKTTSIRQFTTVANGTLDPGVWREYDVVIPLSYEDISPGEHSITASVPEGASQKVSFYIYQSPPNSYVPPQYINYIGASPYITPKTVTVTVTVPGPTQTIIVKETPSKDQIDAAARTVVAQHESEFWGKVETYGSIALIVSIVLIYVLSVIYRRRKKL